MFWWTVSSCLMTVYSQGFLFSGSGEELKEKSGSWSLSLNYFIVRTILVISDFNVRCIDQSESSILSRVILSTNQRAAFCHVTSSQPIRELHFKVNGQDFVLELHLVSHSVSVSRIVRLRSKAILLFNSWQHQQRMSHFVPSSSQRRQSRFT